MKIVSPVLILIALVVALGCGRDCNIVDNPVSKDYPCGTRAHPCQLNPLTCCWNNAVCGGPVGSGCPEGYCCFVGDDDSSFAAVRDAGTVKAVPQFSPR